jgi:zinc D-Ala-D-Ala dipeptidase
VNSDFHQLRDRPVPDCLALSARKAGYRTSVRIDQADPLWSDPCVEARKSGFAGRNHYAHPNNPPYHQVIPGAIDALWLRRGVASRLQAVNSRLAGMGLELYLFDAWRPQGVQRHFHDVWFPDWLQRRRPDLSGEALLREVETYWAAPTTSEASPSPHSTGGAVDLAVVWSATQQPLYMGGIFDDPTDLAWTDWFERHPPRSLSDEEASANRRLLHGVMADAGFCNNPSEWWHYSWGDQMWAQLTGAPAAVYGATEPPGPESN